MDIFDVLRGGISFGKSRKSKGRTFARANLDSHDDGESNQNELDFFGNDAGNSKKKAKTKHVNKEEEEKENNNASSKKIILKEDEINSLRKQKMIKVSGSTAAAAPLNSFDELTACGAPAWLQNAVIECKFKSPSAIQMQAIPSAIRGDHILACAPTGSGKTMSFLIPMLSQMNKPSKAFCRGLVIDPTRELAQQTLRELNRLTKAKKFKARLLDKVSADDVKEGMRVDIGIATPNRLVQILKETDIKLTATKHIVLDEADKLLDLGFAPQIDEILSFCDINSDDLQILLFSATMPSQVVELANSILRSPVKITIGNSQAASNEIEQKLIYAGRDSDKLMVLRQMIREQKVKPPCLIFVQSKERADELFQELVYDGIFVDVIHAGRTRQQRDNTVEAFRAGKIWILICTDLMGRGVDFKGVNVVINYDMPSTSATYIHRIGRTGRAGRKGLAYTLYSDADHPNLRSIVSVVRASGCEVPDWMKSLPKPKRHKKKQGDYSVTDRWTISTKPIKNKKITKSMRDMNKKSKAKAKAYEGAE